MNLTEKKILAYDRLEVESGQTNKGNFVMNFDYVYSDVFITFFDFVLLFNQ